MRGTQLIGSQIRRIIAMVMAVVLVVTMLPVTASAEEGIADTSIYWKIATEATEDGAIEKVLYLGNNNTDEGMTDAALWDMSIFNANPSSSEVAWYDNRGDITKVMVSSSIAPANTACWFEGCSSCVEIDLGKLDTSHVVSMQSMFRNCKVLKNLVMGDKFDTSHVARMDYMFADCAALETLDLSAFNTSNVTRMDNMFYGCSALEVLTFGDEFDTSAVERMSNIFGDCAAVKTLDLSTFDTSNVTSMFYMFNGCKSLTTLVLGEHFDTSNVTDMRNMFSNCMALPSLSLGDRFDTSKVTNMEGMFANCSALTELELGQCFDTSQVMNMSYMFSGCSSMKSLMLGNLFDASKVTSMYYMFNYCSSLERLDLSSVQAPGLTNANSMFRDCSSLEELNMSHFNTENLNGMNYMFSGCSALKKLDMSSIHVSDTAGNSSMFSGTNISVLKTPATNSRENTISIIHTYYEEDDLETGYTYLPVTDGISKTLYRGSTITYELNGGEVEAANPKIYLSKDADYTIELSAPVKGGYPFDGWTVTNGATGNLSVNGNVLTVPKYSYGDATVTAGWEVHTHCVCSGTSCGELHCDTQEWIPWTGTTGLPDSVGYYYLTVDVDLAAAWEPKDGTYLCLNGHSVECADGTAITINGNFTLTDCDVTSDNQVTGGVYNAGAFYISGAPVISGTGVYLPADKVIGLVGALDDNADIAVTMETPGTITSGWSTYMDAEKHPSDYFSSSDIAYGAVCVDEEAVLKTAYLTTIDSPANGTVTVNKASAAEGATVTVTVTPAVGYETDSVAAVKTDDGTTAIELTANEDGTYGFTMPAHGVTLKATFQKITYTVTYAPGAYGAEEQVADIKTYGVDLTLKGAIFTRDGYVQVGWGTKDNGVKNYELNGTYSENKSVTLYPVWKELLTGTVTLTGTPRCGETLTASVTDSNGTGTLRFQWYRVKTAIPGATKSTYTLTTEDVGYSVTCVVTSLVEAGSITSEASAVVQKQEFKDTDIIVSGYNGTYDGQDHGITIALSEHVADAVVAYGTEEGVYEQSVSPAITNAGTLTVYYQVTKEGYETVKDHVTVTVHKAGLTVSAEDCTICYADAAPSYTVVYSGFVNNENESVLGGTLELNCDYMQNSNVGQYRITPGGLTADNYNIAFKPGMLTVGPKKIDITWGDTAFIYNGGAQRPTASTTDFVMGDDVAITVLGAKISANAEGETYTAEARISGADAGNYTFKDADRATVTYTIAKANPEIGTVGYIGDVTDNTKPEDVVLTRTDMKVAGTLVLTDSAMLAGQTLYNWRFTPTGEDARNYNVITGTVEITVKTTETDTGTGDGADDGTSDGSDTGTGDGTDDGGDKEPGDVIDMGLKVRLANPGETYIYSGSAIKPEIIVTNNGEVLTAGVDYTVKYSNNVKASTEQKPAKITVTGKGNLTGSNSATFTIHPRNIDDKEVVAGAIVVTAGSKATPVLVYNNKKLSAKDYTNPSAKAKFTEDGFITIYGKGNFTGSRTLFVDVVDKSELKKFTVTVGKEVRTYNGKEQKPTITVADKASGEILTEGTDYTITYGNSIINAGTVKFTVVGLGCYTGAVTKSYKIKPLAASDMKVTGVHEEGYRYADSGVTIGDDLTVTCQSTGEVLTEGVDYKISYSGNKKVGTAKYTIKFKGNYKGSAAVKGSFIIKAMPLSNDTAGLKIVVGDKVYSGKANTYKSVPLVSIDGVALKSSDYTVTYYKDADMTEQIIGRNKVSLDEGQNSATIYVKIVGKGNYAPARGEYATAEYKVCRKVAYDLSKARVSFWDGSKKITKMEYTGTELEPEVRVECKVGKTWETVPADKYEVAYSNNVNKGTASVVVNAIGSDCAGSKTAKFKIVARNLKSVADLLKDLFGIL